MSEIKVGDLVVVVGSGCEHTHKFIGLVRRAIALGESPVHCALCSWRLVEPIRHTLIAENIRLPTTWLKKIDPLDEPEEAPTSVERDEEKHSHV